METFYLILFTEIAFSVLVSIGLIFFVIKTRSAQKEAIAKREREVGLLENLVNVQDKVLDEYRSTNNIL